MICDPEGDIIIPTEDYPSHFVAKENGVHRFLAADVKPRLDDLLAAFQCYREDKGERITDPTRYPKLPFDEVNPGLWKLRQIDLALMKKLIPSSSCDILELGAWNGWLTNHLSQAGHSLTAVDYFTDPYDGLGARQHYPNANWTALQMDVEGIDVIVKRYDVILFNRCFYAYSNSLAMFEKAKALLKPGGLIIMTGMNILRDGVAFQKQWQKVNEEYQKDYGQPLTLHPLKGYFDKTDQATLEAHNVTFTSYPQLLKANLRSRLQSTKPWMGYALWKG